MAQCPFCKGQVTEAIIIHGGTCPHCFGDIPGEESATDPGEPVKQQLRQEAIQHARKRALAPVMVMVPLFLVAVVVAWMVLQPPPVVEPLVIDDFGQEFTFKAWEGEAVAKVDAQPGKKDPRVAAEVNRSTADARNVAAEKPLKQVVEGGVALDGPRQVGQVTAPGEAAKVDRPASAQADPGAAGSAGLADITASVERKSAVLTDRSDIQRAVKDVLRARGGQLQQCYDRALKSNPTLGGVWRVSFTISREGTFTGVKAQPTGQSDSGFERCVADQVGAWSLRGQLQEPMPVTLPLTFQPS